MRSWRDALLLLLSLLLLFTVSVEGVDHGPSRTEDLSAKLLLGLRDNWKILPGRLKSLCKAQRFGSHRRGRRALARMRMHIEGLGGRERLISLEISEPPWSRSLPLQEQARRWPALWRPLLGVIGDCVPDKRTTPAGAPAAATVR